MQEADLGLHVNHDTLLAQDVGDQKMDSQAEGTQGQADNGHVAVTLAKPLMSAWNASCNFLDTTTVFVYYVKSLV